MTRYGEAVRATPVGQAPRRGMGGPGAGSSSEYTPKDSENIVAREVAVPTAGRGRRRGRRGGRRQDQRQRDVASTSNVPNTYKPDPNMRKLVIRRLPPALTAEAFREALASCPCSVGDVDFHPGSSKKTYMGYGRAYVTVRGGDPSADTLLLSAQKVKQWFEARDRSDLFGASVVVGFAAYSVVKDKENEDELSNELNNTLEGSEVFREFVERFEREKREQEEGAKGPVQERIEGSGEVRRTALMEWTERMHQRKRRGKKQKGKGEGKGRVREGGKEGEKERGKGGEKEQERGEEKTRKRNTKKGKGGSSSSYPPANPASPTNPSAPSTTAKRNQKRGKKGGKKDAGGAATGAHVKNATVPRTVATCVTQPDGRRLFKIIKNDGSQTSINNNALNPNASSFGQ